VAVAYRGRETDSMPQPFPVREKDKVNAIQSFSGKGERGTQNYSHFQGGRKTLHVSSESLLIIPPTA
jgi:hypothetical protein